MITPLSNPPILTQLILESPELFLKLEEAVKGKILQLFQNTSAIVQIKGHAFKAQIPPGMNEGDEFFLQVRQIQPKLYLSPKEQVLRHSNQAKDSVTLTARNNSDVMPDESRPQGKLQGGVIESKRRLPGKLVSSFREGEILRATVKSVMGNNAVLNIKGHSVAFKTPMPLQLGSSIEVEVIKQHPSLLLSISELDIDTIFSRVAKRNSELSFTLSRILQKSGDLMSGGTLLSPSEKKAIFSNIARLFYRGQGVEALKMVSQLFKPSSFNEALAKEGGNSLMDTLIKLLKSSLSQLPARAGEEMESLFKNMETVRQNMPEGFLPLPFFFADELGVAGLWYEKEEGNSSGEDIHSFTLSLDLSVLGPVEAQIRSKGKSISIQFRAEKKEAQEMIRNNMEQLKAILLEMDISVLAADVVMLEKKESYISTVGKGLEEVDLII